jgi:glycosyltransferase involved in cell wall biosynthesis
VVYPGLDPSVHRVDDPNEITRVKAKYNINSEFLVYIGTVQPRKNLQRLIDAFLQLPTPSLQSPISNLQLVIAGKPGWYSDQLHHQADDRVRFVGYVDAADKNALLSGANAFVFPLYEGFGLSCPRSDGVRVPVLQQHFIAARGGGRSGTVGEAVGSG